MPKIIAVDNFDREGPGFDDRLVVFVRDVVRAQKIVDLLNEEVGGHSPIYYKVVPNDYKLKTFVP